MLLKKTKCVICAVITATTCLFSVHTNFISVNQTASADFEKTASKRQQNLGSAGTLEIPWTAILERQWVLILEAFLLKQPGEIRKPPKN